MEFNELLYKRRSVRSFKNEKISDKDILKLIEAGIHAPNACNYQSWHFYIVKDEELKKSFSPDVYGGKWITDASCIIIICTDDERLKERFGDRGTKLFSIQDTAAAINNILLRAADMGYGGCWIGAFDEEECRKLINIESNRRPVALLPIGIPANEPPIRERKAIGEVVTIL